MADHGGAERAGGLAAGPLRDSDGGRAAHRAATAHHLHRAGPVLHPRPAGGRAQGLGNPPPHLWGGRRAERAGWGVAQNPSVYRTLIPSSYDRLMTGRRLALAVLTLGVLASQAGHLIAY